MQICCFVVSLGKAKRQGSLVVANATGTGPSWHAAQQRDAWGGTEGRDKKLGFHSIRCLDITAQSERVLKLIVKFLGIEVEGATCTPNYLSSSKDKWMIENMPGSQNLVHACLPRATPSAHTHPSVSSSLPLHPKLVPSSSGALPQRSTLNHMCHCQACSCSRANCSLVNCMHVGGGAPLHPAGTLLQSWIVVVVMIMVWGGSDHDLSMQGSDHDLSMHFIFPV